MTILAKYLSGKKENKVVLILLTNRKEFFKIPLKYSEEKKILRKIIFEFKKEKKKRKL